MQAKKERIYTLDEMMEMRRKGVTLRELAKILGVTRQRVQQILGPTRAIIPHRYYPTPEERKEKYRNKRIADFWSKVDRGGPDECWNWRGCLNNVTGYGHYRLDGVLGSHRIAYVLANGKIPSGKFILHSCDNPACCNPAHLRVGTPQENVKDRDERGHHRVQSGGAEYYRQRNKEIVEQYNGSVAEIPALAEKYSVCGQMIYKVIRRAKREEVSHA